MIGPPPVCNRTTPSPGPLLQGRHIANNDLHHLHADAVKTCIDQVVADNCLSVPVLPGDKLPNGDLDNMMQPDNLCWNTPSGDSSGSMPLGNGVQLDADYRHWGAARRR